MNRVLNTQLITLSALLLSTAAAQASAPARFVCAARVDCGAPGLPSTQDLPTDRTPTVVSRTVEAARTKCGTIHTDAYLALAKSIEGLTPTNALTASRGCKIVSEAFLEK